MGQLRDHLDIGNGLVEDNAVDGLHILVDEIKQGLQALPAVACVVYGNYAAQDASPKLLAGVIPVAGLKRLKGTLPQDCGEANSKNTAPELSQKARTHARASPHQ